MIPGTITTISDLRFKTKQVLASAAKAPVFVFHRSTPRGVLLSVAEYQEIMDTLEDYYLSLRAQEYEKEEKKGIPWISDKKLRTQLARR